MSEAERKMLAWKTVFAQELRCAVNMKRTWKLKDIEETPRGMLDYAQGLLDGTTKPPAENDAFARLNFEQYERWYPAMNGEVTHESIDAEEHRSRLALGVGEGAELDHDLIDIGHGLMSTCWDDSFPNREGLWDTVSVKILPVPEGEPDIHVFLDGVDEPRVYDSWGEYMKYMGEG